MSATPQSQDQPRQPAGYCDRCGSAVSGRFCGACGGAVRSARIDRYEVGRPIGFGRFGRVLGAYDPRLERPVAIRVLGPVLVQDAAALRTYLASVGRAASLQHPNCVAVYTVVAGTDDAPPAVVMELVEGIPLSAISPTVEAPALIWLADGALSGLCFLHAHGISHGRVSGGAILVNRDGESKLGDAGLALDPSDRWNAVLLAPEQRRGSQPTWAGDVFTAAATIWQALAGGGAPDRQDAVPDAIRDAFAPALAADPTTRPTAAELQARLRSAADECIPSWRSAGQIAAAAAVGTAVGSAAGAATAAGSAAAGGAAAGGSVSATAAPAVTTTLMGKSGALIMAGTVGAAAVVGGAVAVRMNQPPPAVAQPVLGPICPIDKGHKCEVVSRADVDGDGSGDQVALTRLNGGRCMDVNDCRSTWALRVQTADGQRSTVDVPVNAPLGEHGYPQSAFVGAQAVDGLPGRELVVLKNIYVDNPTRYEVYGWRGRGLQRVPAPDREPDRRGPAPAEWWLNGFTGGTSVIRCLEPGVIVWSVGRAVYGDFSAPWRWTEVRYEWKNGAWHESGQRAWKGSSGSAVGGWQCSDLPTS